MHRTNWMFPTLITIVLAIVGILQTGLLKSSLGSTSVKLETRSATERDFFATESGWRYQRGQPNHWKYLIMHEAP